MILIEIRDGITNVSNEECVCNVSKEEGNSHKKDCHYLEYPEFASRLLILSNVHLKFDFIFLAFPDIIICAGDTKAIQQQSNN